MSKKPAASQSLRYSEYEIIRSKDGRVYSLAKFSSYKEKQLIPDSESFKSPLHIKFAEAETNQKEDTGKEKLSYDEKRDQGYFRTRRWYHDKEYDWKLFDAEKSDSNCYIGTEEASTLNYLVLVPPADKFGQFKAHQVSNITNFVKKKKYNPLSLDQAEIMIEKKVKFGSTLMKKIMEKQQETNPNTSSVKAEKPKKSKISSFEEDEKRVQEAQDDDVETLAIDRMDGRATSNSFADFDNVFEDDEDDSKELIEETKVFENERDEEVMNNVDEEPEAVDELEEEDFDDNTAKTENNEQSAPIASPSAVISNETKASNVVVDENDPKKNERKKFTESLLAKGLKRKVEINEEERPVKKKRVLSDMEKKIVLILKSNGGKMRTKDLVKNARKENLIADKVIFKNALTVVGALENNKGTKMVVLKAEFTAT